MIDPTLSWWEQTSIIKNSAVWKSATTPKHPRIPNSLWLSLEEKGEA